MDNKRLQELLDQAIVDCYDEEEEFGASDRTVAPAGGRNITPPGPFHAP